MGESRVNIRQSRGFELPRDVVVTVVPAGHSVVVEAGEEITVSQALGSAATVTLPNGEMARLSAADSVEFGLIAAPEPSEAATGEFDLDAVWAAAATVFDPEIPVDIVELGLIYRIEAIDRLEGDKRVEIDMSVTAPFCGMGDIMRQDLENAVVGMPGVGEVDVKLVFDPPWDQSRMSDVARLELGMM